MAIIGVTDSGLGGLTILKSLYNNDSNHKYIYYADNSNSPYGQYNKDKILTLTRACCEKLIEMGSDIIVIACNTATSAAIDSLRQYYNVPIVGTEPAIMPAIHNNHHKTLVLATPFTIYSGRYASLTYRFYNRLINCPCRDLARLIDEAAPDFSVLYDYVKCILKPFNDADAIVLGCTHYVLIKSIISSIMPKAKIYDSSDGIAKRVNYLVNQKDYKYVPKYTQIIASCDTDIYKEVFSNLLVNKC